MLDCQVKLSGKKLGQGYQSLGEEQKLRAVPLQWAGAEKTKKES